MNETEFAPSADITREQLAVMLHRYMMLRNTESEEKYLNEDSFADFDEIADYAYNGIGYVVSKGIMSGRGNNEFCPKEKATRAEVASVIMRLMAVTCYEK